MAKKTSKQKKAEKQIKKYYGEKKADVTTKAATDTARYAEDLQTILNDAGVKQNRATQDYITNVGNIEANKSIDVRSLNDYVVGHKEDTQGNLDTSLATETRRFSLESDAINQDLADKGLTFSERKPETVAQAGNALNVKTAQGIADRSFADIARYEATQNADIQNKYGQQEAAAGVTKARTIEDVLNDNAKAAVKAQRGTSDVAFGKAVDIRDINYNQSDTLSGIQNAYDMQKTINKNTEMITKVRG